MGFLGSGYDLDGFWWALDKGGNGMSIHCGFFSPSEWTTGGRGSSNRRRGSRRETP